MVKARCVKRTIPSERYDKQLLLQMMAVRYQGRQSLRVATAGTAHSWDELFFLFRGADGKLRSGCGDDSSYVTDLLGKKDTNHVDVEQQNAERRQDETVELSPEVPLPDGGEDRR